MTAIASDWRAKRKQRQQAQQREIQEAIDRGDLIVRHASADELARFHDERAAFLEKHPEMAAESMKVRAVLRRKVEPEPVAQPEKPSIEPRDCQECGRRFTPRTHWQRYDSQDCARRAQTRRATARARAKRAAA